MHKARKLLKGLVNKMNAENVICSVLVGGVLLALGAAFYVRANDVTTRTYVGYVINFTDFTDTDPAEAILVDVASGALVEVDFARANFFPHEFTRWRDADYASKHAASTVGAAVGKCVEYMTTGVMWEEHLTDVIRTFDCKPT